MRDGGEVLEKADLSAVEIKGLSNNDISEKGG